MVLVSHSSTPSVLCPSFQANMLLPQVEGGNDSLKETSQSKLLTRAIRSILTAAQTRSYACTPNIRCLVGSQLVFRVEWTGPASEGLTGGRGGTTRPECSVL